MSVSCRTDRRSMAGRRRRGGAGTAPKSRRSDCLEGAAGAEADPIDSVGRRTEPLKAAVFPALILAAALQNTASEFVELDVVAMDRHGLPVRDLSVHDLEVKDSGRPVTIETFTPVAARGVRDEERSVVLLMDDEGVPSSGTSPMRQIGRLLLSPMDTVDEVAVVRLSRSRDEAYDDVETARERIDQYHGGAVPYSSRDTPIAVLEAVARIAEQLQPIEHRRKAVVCLGLPSVCDVREPVSSSTNEFRKAWVAALSGAARANVGVYEVDPTGLTHASGPSGLGLVRLTGGDVLRNSNDFAEATARIWRESSRYYLLGYWGAPSAPGQLRTIDVKSTRRDIEVRARRFR